MKYLHCKAVGFPRFLTEFIYNYQGLEAAQVSISRWVDKTTLVYLHHGILLGNKKKNKNFTLSDNMDGLEKHYTKWNKPVRERQKPCDFTYIWKLMKKKS